MLQNFTLGSFAQGVSAGGAAFESIASITPSAGATSVTFSSIPSTYQSLQIRYLARRNAAGTLNVYLRPNSDSTSNKSYHYLRGDGSAVSASGVASNSRIYIGDATGSGNTSNVFGIGIVDIHDYASTTRNKTVRSFNGFDDNGSGWCYLSSGCWQSTSAITSLEFEFAGDDLASGSTFALYGIKGA